ncbi:hypothetical protein FD754_001249 [Muntiacus muntjak]|uniref:Lipocalin/cytosolic fatty-acid binding domain-containing protein n=1 Tax=Muntiacus muntjak TaxID=9888 RepID=A0A5N3W6N5_MUNMU|nr:hypothetical protein FD754_001249 [Muntiacus muntjak]
MLTPRIAALLTLLLASSSLGQRARRPPRPPSPISTIQPKANFDTQQFAGTWLLVAVASPCRYLQEQGHRAEATTLHVAPRGSAMAVTTFRKLDGICWAVRQLYGDAGRPGRFLLQARGARGPVDVVVGDTDYGGFAVLYLERARQLSVKLYGTSGGPGSPGAVGWAGWALSSLPPAPALLPKCGGRTGAGRGGRGQIAAPGTQPSPQSALQAPAPWVHRSPCVPRAVRSLPVSDPFLSVFEQRVQGANLTEDHILFFPKYGECPPHRFRPARPAPPPPAALTPGPAPRLLRGGGPVPHPGR